MKKLRVDGETICCNKTYPGYRVIQLLEKSFDNGRIRGALDESRKHVTSVAEAFQKGVEYARDNDRNGKDWEVSQITVGDITVLQYQCSCGFATLTKYHFCPDCGNKFNIK